jgi:hypothetical protein
MAEPKGTRRRARRKLPEGIVEIECAELRTVAHRELEAVELTVVDPNGNGYRTWIGADLAPHAALRFCAATVRLVEAIPT